VSFTTAIGSFANEIANDPGVTGLGRLERVVDLAGVVAFGLSGALLAVRKHFDVVGIVVLAVTTALGGGVLRDLLMSQGPPRALQDSWYLVFAVTSALVAAVAHPVLARVARPVVVFDAVGLGLYCVVGAARGMDAGFSVAASVVLGGLSAVGGGIVRDVLAQEVPIVFRPDSTLYAIPAAGGALLTALVWQWEWHGPATVIVTVMLVVAIRLGSLHFGWRAPGARRAR
jgi:uncharacterized membrane protein YeiH